MPTVSDVAINVIDKDVDCPNIRVCQQNSENVPKIKKIKRKDLTEEEKNEIANYLVLNCNNGKMKHGTIEKAASKFGLHRNTISLIWNRIQKKSEKEELILICYQGKKLLMVQNQKIGVLFWKK